MFFLFSRLMRSHIALRRRRDSRRSSRFAINSLYGTGLLSSDRYKLSGAGVAEEDDREEDGGLKGLAEILIHVATPFGVVVGVVLLLWRVLTVKGAGCVVVLSTPSAALAVETAGI